MPQSHALFINHVYNQSANLTFGLASAHLALHKFNKSQIKPQFFEQGITLKVHLKKISFFFKK